MPINRSKKAIIEHRRRAVAAARLRGLTIREIEEKLFNDGVYNEKDDKPWSRGVIGNDLKAMESEWKEASQSDIAQHKANVYAEILEVRRAAWKDGRIDLVLRGLEDERKLFGLDAPAGTGTMENPGHTVNYTPQEWLAEQKRRREEAEATDTMFGKTDE